VIAHARVDVRAVAEAAGDGSHVDAGGDELSRRIVPKRGEIGAAGVEDIVGAQRPYHLVLAGRGRSDHRRAGLAILTAAWPVPPAAAWISTVRPAVMQPSGLSAASAVGQLTTRPSDRRSSPPARGPPRPRAAPCTRPNQDRLSRSITGAGSRLRAPIDSGSGVSLRLHLEKGVDTS
jgi:hypothetical protein